MQLISEDTFLKQIHINRCLLMKSLNVTIFGDRQDSPDGAVDDSASYFRRPSFVELRRPLAMARQMRMIGESSILRLPRALGHCVDDDDD